MELKYIDIGLNLMGKQFDSDRETVAADSFAAGVGFIVTGTDLKSDRAAVDYLKKSKFEHAWCTCGIHPHNADRWDENYSSRAERGTGLYKIDETASGAVPEKRCALFYRFKGNGIPVFTAGMLYRNHRLDL